MLPATGVPADANAASFDSVRDDVFSRIASRYDVLCDPQNAEKARDLLARLTL